MFSLRKNRDSREPASYQMSARVQLRAFKLIKTSASSKVHPLDIQDLSFQQMSMLIVILDSEIVAVIDDKGID